MFIKGNWLFFQLVRKRRHCRWLWDILMVGSSLDISFFRFRQNDYFSGRRHQLECSKNFSYFTQSIQPVIRHPVQPWCFSFPRLSNENIVSSMPIALPFLAYSFIRFPFFNFYLKSFIIIFFFDATYFLPEFLYFLSLKCLILPIALYNFFLSILTRFSCRKNVSFCHTFYVVRLSVVFVGLNILLVSRVI